MADVRLIDANEVMQRNEEAFRKAKANPAENLVSVIQYHTVKEMVSSSPTVDAVEVVHGRWVRHYHDSGEPIDDKWYCSECHMCNNHRRTCYCPNCGAKMDLEVTNNG